MPKINREKMRTLIAGCFIGPFGQHPADLKRAFKFLCYLRKEQIGWATAETEIKAYLKNNRINKYSETYINTQVRNAKKMIHPWLDSD